MLEPADTTQEFAAYRRETVRKLLERQSGVFAVVLAFALALDAHRLHPSRAFAKILERLPLQIAVCLAAFVVLRTTRIGARSPTVVGTVAYATLAGFGGRLLGDLGGLDGPFFYSAYVLPTFMMILPVTLAERLLMTGATVLAFVATFFAPHPEHLDYRFAHIAFAYLAVITAVNVHFGHRVMLLIRERFIMERALERHGVELARDNQRLEERVRRQTGSVRALLDRVESSRQEARTELARDLHDDMGQLVVGTRLELQQIERALDAGQSLSTEHLAYLHGLVDRLDRQVRDRVHALRAPGARGCIEDALVELAGTYARMSEVHIAVAVALEAEPEAPLHEGIVAIAREALTNALKHASARRVDVRVGDDARRVLLEIEDDGVGYDPGARTPDGFGIVGMRERVEALGGELGVVSPAASGMGTRVWARFSRGERAGAETPP